MLYSLTNPTLTAIVIPFFNWLRTFTIFIVLDDKGGVCKSFQAQIVGSIIRYFDYNLMMIDTDFSNSSTAQIDPSTKMLNLEERLQTGILINLVKVLSSGNVSHAIIDVGAREEGKVRKLLPWFVPLVRKAGGRVVVIRPITLGSHNQRNAASFMNLAAELQIPVVFIRNECQGRSAEYFDRWNATETCGIALALGAVQTSITDADVRYVDEAVGLGLSMMDVATGDFQKLQLDEELDPDADPEAQDDFVRRRAEAEEDYEAARAFFTDDVVAFVNEWLRYTILVIGTAIQDAIEKRARLDEPHLEEESAPDREENASHPKTRRGRK